MDACFARMRTNVAQNAFPASRRTWTSSLRVRSKPPSRSVLARGSEMIGGDIGARDPFEGELVTGFGNKPLGNADTEHQIRAPDAIANLVGLGTKKCVPCDASTPILSEKDVERLRNQVPGWRLGKSSEGKLSLFQEWKMKDFSSALTCFQRIGEVADSEGHHPDLHLTDYNQVRVELYTHAAGGLTENDFILAFKLNELDFSDLVPKRKMRLWA